MSDFLIIATVLLKLTSKLLTTTSETGICILVGCKELLFGVMAFNHVSTCDTARWTKGEILRGCPQVPIWPGCVFVVIISYYSITGWSNAIMYDPGLLVWLTRVERLEPSHLNTDTKRKTIVISLCPECMQTICTNLNGHWQTCIKPRFKTFIPHSRLNPNSCTCYYNPGHSEKRIFLKLWLHNSFNSLHLAVFCF